MTQRILVTGGAGFIGSHLCHRLIAEGHRVTCLDDLSTGARRNLAGLLEHERFTLLEQDVALPMQVEVDAIYNLACPASPVHYQRDPVKTVRTTVLGAISVLDLARRLDVPVLQASTSEVYGDPEQHPQREAYWGNVNPIGLRACYDEGKRCAETLFFDYSRQYGVPIKIVRIFNTYGPHMALDDGRVVSNFIVQALRGEDITLYGDGGQTRSFGFVSETVDGLVRMMATERGVTGPVNIGNPAEFSIRELAELVLDLTGSASRIIYAPLPVDDPRQRQPDITLAGRLLGWQPHVGLREGLGETIAWFRRRLAEQA